MHMHTHVRAHTQILQAKHHSGKFEMRGSKTRNKPWTKKVMSAEAKKQPETTAFLLDMLKQIIE